MHSVMQNDGLATPYATHRADSAQTLAALRRFAHSRPDLERCELCGTELDEIHPHLLNRESRKFVCACEACAILFCGQERAKFLRIPRRLLRLERFAFDELEWDSMTLPINMAFFLRRPGGETTALYPSPAGAMTSEIELLRWNELFAREPVLQAVEPEVEALLVNRIANPPLYFVAPIDVCYRLVGLIRTQWRGLSGGPDVWRAIAEFFARLDHEATHLEAHHA
jgi:hypothetical protein